VSAAGQCEIDYEAAEHFCPVAGSEDRAGVDRRVERTVEELSCWFHEWFAGRSSWSPACVAFA
jgi:hypothetical protein